MKWFWAGLIVYAVITGCVLSTYGSHWEIGQYGMPKSLIDASGKKYPDGTPVDPMTMVFVTNGVEELAFASVMLIIAFIFAYAGFGIWRSYVHVKKMDAIRRAAAPLMFPVVPTGHADHIRYSFEMACGG